MKVFIIPNLSININQNLVFSTKAELPIYSNLDGTQLEVYRQLGMLYYELEEYEYAVEPLLIFLTYGEELAPQYWIAPEIG